MKSFTVHERPDPPADRLDRAERLVFIKDGFSLVAALFTPLWLLAHRLWWALLGYVAIIVALQGFGLLVSVDQRWLTLASIGVGLLFGFEADALRRWGLQLRGWQMVGSTSGRSLEECERRFFEGWLSTQPLIAPPTGSSHFLPRTEERRGWVGFGRLKGA